MSNDGIERGADISACGIYRWSLWRIWDRSKPVGAFIGLNPSTADAEKDDNTIRREIGFARRWGWGGFWKFNLWPYRSTDPKALWSAADPVGPLGDETLAAIKTNHRGEWAAVIAAWGAQKHPRFTSREARARILLDGVPLQCIGPPTGDGHPRHPLYLSYDLDLRPWPVATR